MNKLFLSLALAAVAVSAVSAKGPKDPELMTIGGTPVKLSEFEYLYNKNNSQQLQPQTVEEYLGLFVTYKQKVAAAREAGIDKSQAFQNEFEGYRRDLSEPYLKDQAVEDSILRAEYERMKTERDVSHIMIALGDNPAADSRQKQLLDSIRTAIIGGSDFAGLARKFSIDRSVTRNGGHMGYITAARFPYTFEDAAYETKVGEISPVIRTPFGFHIVKVNGERPAQGQVLVEHILKLTQGMDPQAAAVQKAKIDSIYTLVTAGGADFEDVATRESEDPGSAKNGGRLNWFGSGQMVPEFEQTAFSLADGAISEPFATSYGYHIIKRLEGKGIDPYETVHPMLKKVISQDERGQLPRQRRVEQLKKKYGVQLDQAAIEAVKKEIAANMGLDSAMTARFLASETPVAKINKQPLMLSEVMAEMGNPFIGTGEQQAAQFEGLVNRAVESAVLDLAREDLAREEPQYGNLVNEYRDGMLLFEISDRNVWSKAKEDKEGLEKFFEANRARYAWDKPRLKSYVVFATSDSVCSAAKAYLETNKVPNDSLGLVLRREFGNNVKVERVLAAKGENPITDFIAFGGEKPAPKGRWAFYFPYQNRVILQPEDAGDVRGAVTGDYQNHLEEKWVAALREKYPAKINQKVLKQARKNQEAAAKK